MAAKAFILQGSADAIPLADGCVQCVVTSPPYFGLRDYGLPPSVWGGDTQCSHEWGDVIRVDVRGLQVTPSGTLAGPQREDARKSGRGRSCAKCGAWCGCLGLEPTPEMYVAHMVAVFREVRRVLRPDGVAWLNIGDSYATTPRGNRVPGGGNLTNSNIGSPVEVARWEGGRSLDKSRLPGVKPKDLLMIPHRVAIAIQADGWWVRSDNVWAKRSPMPEPVRDRTTRAHEYVFQLTKAPRYYYDSIATAEPAVSKHPSGNGYKRDSRVSYQDARGARGNDEQWQPSETRNRRSVWTLSTKPLKAAHFATMPPKLAEICILASTSEKGCCPHCRAPFKRQVKRVRVPTRPAEDTKTAKVADTHGRGGMIVGNRDPERHVTTTETVGWVPTCKCEPADPVPCLVFDPFGGAGTTARVCQELGRSCVLVELNPEYIGIIRDRLAQPIKPAKVKRAKVVKAEAGLFDLVA